MNTSIKPAASTSAFHWNNAHHVHTHSLREYTKISKMSGPDLSLLPTPPEFESPTNADIISDIQYSSQGHVRQRLDLYLPKPEHRRNDRPIPLIVYIHGKLNQLTHSLTHSPVPLANPPAER